MCTVGGRIGWIGTRSGTARRPGIAGPTTTGTYYGTMCTRTDIVTRKMEFKDSSILSNVLNIDTSDIIIELSDDCT